MSSTSEDDVDDAFGSPFDDDTLGIFDDAFDEMGSSARDRGCPNGGDVLHCCTQRRCYSPAPSFNTARLVASGRTLPIMQGPCQSCPIPVPRVQPLKHPLRLRLILNDLEAVPPREPLILPVRLRMIAAEMEEQHMDAGRTLIACGQAHINMVAEAKAASQGGTNASNTNATRRNATKRNNFLSSKHFFYYP